MPGEAGRWIAEYETDDEDEFDLTCFVWPGRHGHPDKLEIDDGVPLDVALAVILVHMGLDAVPVGRDQVIESALATIRFDPEDALRKADLTAHDTFDAMLVKACAGRTVVSAIAFIQTVDGNVQALAFHPAGHLVTCTAANAQGFALEAWRTHGCPRTPEDAAAAGRRLEHESTNATEDTGE